MFGKVTSFSIPLPLLNLEGEIVFRSMQVLFPPFAPPFFFFFFCNDDSLCVRLLQSILFTMDWVPPKYVLLLDS
jgi:hypothetical protein